MLHLSVKHVRLFPVRALNRKRAGAVDFNRRIFFTVLFDRPSDGIRILVQKSDKIINLFVILVRYILIKNKVVENIYNICNKRNIVPAERF